MVSEPKIVSNPNEIPFMVLGMLRFEQFQNSDLFPPLSIDSGVVSENLQRHQIPRFVVVSLEDHSKSAFAQRSEHLVAISDVIARERDVEPVSVVETSRGWLKMAFSCGTTSSDEVDERIVQNFRPFESGEESVPKEDF
jgi:hypothetical protein